MNTCGLRILPHLFPQIPPRSPLVINAYYYASIYFAADKNRYIGAVSIGFGPDGKRVRRKVSGKTKQEVRDKLKTLHAELDAGVQPIAGYGPGCGG